MTEQEISASESEIPKVQALSKEEKNELLRLRRHLENRGNGDLSAEEAKNYVQLEYREQFDLANITPIYYRGNKQELDALKKAQPGTPEALIGFYTTRSEYYKRAAVTDDPRSPDYSVLKSSANIRMAENCERVVATLKAAPPAR
jgi:hypothetical protein